MGENHFLFRLHILNVKRKIVICPHTLDIKTPLQLTTLNVKSTACDLFDVSMGINHGEIHLPKYWLYSPNAVSPSQKGLLPQLKRAPCSRTIREQISRKLKSKHVSPVTVFSSAAWGLTTRTLRYLYQTFITTTCQNV